MRPRETSIYIVEDDASVRDSLGLLLGLRGYPVVLFADAESFLEAYQPDWRGCLLLDIKMPRMDGLTLQKTLREKGTKLPIIVMSGHGNIESARQAFRAEAVDFLEKPIDQERLMSAIAEAFSQASEAQRRDESLSAFEHFLGNLTPREKEVMKYVVAGRHNREIAEILGISPRTVEVHKAHMMEKLRVKSVPDLVRLSLSCSPD